jgi:isopenicillin N synthase-like dioxygenase
VAGHGVTDDVVRDAFAVNRQLFGLPAAAKQALLADSNNRGWTPYQEVRRTRVPNMCHASTHHGCLT